MINAITLTKNIQGEKLFMKKFNGGQLYLAYS